LSSRWHRRPSAYRDRTIKLAWYRKYGVRECWFVDPHARQVNVADCDAAGENSFAGAQPIRSRVLAELVLTADECFS
jgi:Uma2 family endonuclease